MTEENVVLTRSAYNTLKELSDLTIKVANDPKTRRKYADIVNEIEPGRKFHDVEAQRLEEKLEKRFEKQEQDRQKKESLAALEAQKNRLKERYDDKAIGEMEAWMEKNSISNYDVAAEVYSAILKPANPTYTQNDHQWKMPDIDMKDFGNLKQMAQADAYKVIDEIKRNRVN